MGSDYVLSELAEQWRWQYPRLLPSRAEHKLSRGLVCAEIPAKSIPG